MAHICHVCGKEVGEAHSCKTCNNFVHMTCGTGEGEEGYGQKVLCNICQNVSKSHDDELLADLPKKSLKRQVPWDWKKGGPAPKKQPPATNKSDKSSEKYICLECFELSLRGKRDEKFTSLCRKDSSSINRHKERWHKGEESRSCTIVPATAPEVRSLRNDSKKSEALRQSFQKTSKESLEEDSSPTNKQNPVTSQSIDVNQESDQSSSLEEKSQATLLSYRKADKSSSTSINDVIKAIDKLSLKIDQFENHHATLEQMFCEDDSLRLAMTKMREAKNIYDLTNASELIEFFYDEDSETGILRCLPCYKMHRSGKPFLGRLSPFEAQRKLNPSTNGNICSGILLNKNTTRLLIEGGNQVWYRQKKSCIDHLCLIGEGSKVHKNSMEFYQREKENEKKRASATSNIFRAAIADLKIGAAALHFETLLSLLACCSVDVGNIGHGRNKFNEVLYCLEKTVNRRINNWLNRPLPSTHLPPHIWATVDKATPARTTNQAVLVVARDANGVPCPIPVDAPVVYKTAEVASYDTLAKILTEAIESNFSKDVLSRLCGVSADGPYQASGFRAKLIEILEIMDNSDDNLALPVTWDSAHALNLAVVGVKDSATATGEAFRRFVKRCNVFNTLLANGKGFAFLQLVDKSSRRPVSYACQRFASSSFDQWLKIEKSYSSFWKAFELLHPNRSDDEQLQYMIGGSDFVADLLAFIDVLQPVVDLMLRVQSLDTPIWKLKLLWPIVEAQLFKASQGDPEAFPRLNKVKDNLRPGYKFQGVTLLEGWLVTQNEGNQASDKRFTWQLREDEEIDADHKRLALDLKNSLEERVKSVTSDPSYSVLQVFDAVSLVKLHCGCIFQEKLKLNASDGEYDSYGVEECKAVLATVSKMPHVIASGMDFDPRLAFRYMSQIKEAVKAGIWKLLCPEWFIQTGDSNNPVPRPQEATLVRFQPVQPEGYTLDTYFEMEFSNGKIFKVRLHEQSVYKSFYSNEEVCSIAKPPSCAVIDVVLAKGGPEAIAESYYGAMRAQQQSVGQTNQTLARRTKLNWCLPSVKNCESIVKESVQLYLKGDDEIRPHRQRAFFSEKFCVSKVVDRVDSDVGRCPFLVNADHC